MRSSPSEGTGATLEDVARRAGVGIGTLYRHFPTRQDLLEAVYLEEVEAICDSAKSSSAQPPLEALTGWLHEFVGFAATKRALAEELFAYVDRDSPVFRSLRDAIYGAGEGLLERAQASGAVRDDVDISDVTKWSAASPRSATPSRADRPHPRPRPRRPARPHLAGALAPGGHFVVDSVRVLVPPDDQPGLRRSRILRGLIRETGGFVLLTVLSPLLLLAAAAVDLTLWVKRRKPWMAVRLLVLVWWFLLCELRGLGGVLRRGYCRAARGRGTPPRGAVASTACRCSGPPGTWPACGGCGGCASKSRARSSSAAAR